MSDLARALVMVVDDDADLRDALCQSLALEGFDAIPQPGGEAALAAIPPDWPGVVLTDLRMPGMDGQALFARLHAFDPELPVVIMTGHGDLPTAVDLMRAGAYDFLAKPFALERLLPTVRRAVDMRALVIENRRLRSAPVEDAGAGGLIGASVAIERVRAALRQLAPADLPVLLIAETGTGKSYCTALLHRFGPRARQPLQVIDCGALPPEHADSFLFGHASGAFAGANLPRTGQLRQAQRGTLVLDQVDRLPLALQGRLARVLESGMVTAVGGDTALPLECRVVATAGPAIRAAVAAGEFDAALYYRLARYVIELPPLRERREDVLPLFRAFLADAIGDESAIPQIAPAVWARLREYDWPGNVRELASYAEAVALGLDAAPGQPARAAGSAGLRDAVAAFEAECIRAALSAAAGDIEAARAALRLPRKTLYDKLARHGIAAAAFRPR